MRAPTTARLLGLLLGIAPASCGPVIHASDAGPDDGPTVMYDVTPQRDTVTTIRDVVVPPADVPSGYHTVEADNYTLPRVGGAAQPNPYTASCAAGAVAVGIGGRAGLWEDQLSLLCAPVRADGSLGGAATLPGAGGTGGGPFTDACSAGEVVVEVRGRYGLYIDSLAIGCAPLTGQVGGTASVSQHATHGGDGGTVSYDERCDTGYMVDGLSGEYGAYVDSLNPRCVRVAP